MYRLMRIEKEKARERMVAGKAPDPLQIFAGGNARDKTAAAFGISGETMRKEMQIVKNRDTIYQTAQNPCTAIILHRCIDVPEMIRSRHKNIQGFLTV